MLIVDFSYSAKPLIEKNLERLVTIIKKQEFVVEIIEEMYECEKLSTIKISKSDFSVELFSYGASITELCLPDRTGKMENIVLSFSNKQSYLTERGFLGASVGRCAGRIAGGEYLLNGQRLDLEKNEGENHLHGGNKGFDTTHWIYEVVEEETAVTVTFSHTFEDGEGGYPGNLAMEISYTVFADQRIKICYRGVADKDTLLNPTNHTYFNLSGGREKNVANHYLKISSDYYASLNQVHLPVYPLIDSTGTDFDFNETARLTSVFESENHQIVQENGLNHPIFLKEVADAQSAPITLCHPESGRQLRIKTTNSYVICYTGNHFETSGDPAFHGGIALETQELYEEGMALGGKSSVVLEKGEIVSSWTEWSFDLLDDSV